MSWFDATGFANLAKSALKEAQKTIDKALDIKDEEPKVIPTNAAESDFFATWGIKSEKENEQQNKTTSQKQQGSNSIWGSFTGSFFENPKLPEGEPSKNIRHSKSLQNTTEKVEKTELVSSTSLPDHIATQIISESLSKNDSESTDVCNEDNTSLSSTTCDSSASKELCHTDIAESDSSHQEPISNSTDTSSKQLSHVQESTAITTNADDTSNKDEVEIKEKESTNVNVIDLEKKDVLTTDLCKNNALNRISIISSGSDKKSLESVEVLGSESNTDCTTTPESDANSISNSLSPTMGVKLNSESVEILPDSLVTSPSSVEILGDWKSDSSPYLSPLDPKNLDESPILDRDDSVTPCAEMSQPSFNSKDDQSNPSSSDISPYESPMEEMKNLNTDSNSDTNENLTSTTSSAKHDLYSSDGSKISPDSVEVIPYTDEVDEVSLADDSYTSASESTVMTIMETLQHYDQGKPKMELTGVNLKVLDSCLDNRQIPIKQETESQWNICSDPSKDKHNLHLPLEPITTQPVRKLDNLDTQISKKTDTSPFEQLMTTTIEPLSSDIHTKNEQPQGPETVQNTEGADQHLMLTDSSCEGTLIESSSEDNATLMCTTEQKIIETPLSTSSYVKNMLADAMVEKGEIDIERHCMDIPRENSPISSESRSDLVKIGSDQTSGHTSGDELETTTSSDIEIISSPNGDSSSTQSRQSPAKLQLSKGCDLLTKTLKTRGHSRELSEISIGSDDMNLEIEKLLKRIQEMTEILEARESKLIDVSRMNMELNEQNNNLKRQLDSIEKHAEQNQNLNQITDDYTQRLSALERKFQQAIRERDSLRKNLDQIKQEAASRLSSQEISTINAEKDEIIKELREEGEKLSKQQLQHSNIIKKLRIKEKENDTIIKNQKEQIEEQSSELERLKRSLYAKEEVEQSQIKAIDTLTAKTKKQEKELLSLQEKLDNTLHKMEAYKKSLDAAKKDLAETKKTLVTTEEELKQAVQNAGESCQLFAQVETLKVKLRQAEEAHVKREEFLKHENSELLKRLEVAETRSEELSESVSVATKPLLRQLEQLQANLLQKTNNFMKQEKALSEKNIELETKLEKLIDSDRSMKEENVTLHSKVSLLESKLKVKEAEVLKIQEMCEKLKVQNEELSEENKRYQQMIDVMEQTHTNLVKDLKREINSLENKLAVEKAATDAERRKNQAILEQQQSIDEELRLSPTLSIGKESVSSVNSVWPAFNDCVYDNGSGRFPIYDGIRSGSTSTPMFENLQAQLKQRDGEIQQLQWELSRRNMERDALNTELSTLTLKVEELNNKITEVQAVNENLSEIQTRYDALLQMYGEKVEENQELRLDLEDVKEMYKSQIDQLLKRDV